MPENESLTDNPRTANRWRPLIDRLNSDKSPVDIFTDLEIQFHRALQNVWKHWRIRGVDPAALFEAALNDPTVLPDLVRKARNDDYAQLLADAAVSEPGCNREGLIRNWLDAVWERVRSLIQLDRHMDRSMEELLDRVNPMLDRMARGLSENPACAPSCPRRPRSNKSADLDDTLSTSLL